MTAREVRFRNINDTDRDEKAAIQPIGIEPAHPNNANRPLENLRVRTERLRANANAQAFKDDTKFVLDGAPTGIGDVIVTWFGAHAGGAPVGNAGKILPLSGDLHFIPLGGPGEYRGTPGANYQVNSAPFSPHLSWADFDNGAGDVLRLVSNINLNDGGHWTSLEIKRDPGNLVLPLVEVFGQSSTSADSPFLPGRREIVVTISRGDNGLGDTITTWDMVISEIAGNAVANSLVTTNIQAGLGTGAAAEFPPTRLRRGQSAGALRLTFIALEDFFTASAENLIREGDTLVAYFANEKSLWDKLSSGAVIDITDSELLNLSRATEISLGDKPHIVIGRCLNNKFHLHNGTVLFQDQVSVPFAHSTSINALTYIGDTLNIPTGTVQAFLNALADQVDDLIDGSIVTDSLGINCDGLETITYEQLLICADNNPTFSKWLRNGPLAVDDALAVLEFATKNTVGGHDGVRAAIRVKEDVATLNETEISFELSGPGVAPATLERVVYFALEGVRIDAAKKLYVDTVTSETALGTITIEADVDLQEASKVFDGWEIYGDGDDIDLTFHDTEVAPLDGDVAGSINWTPDGGGHTGSPNIIMRGEHDSNTQGLAFSMRSGLFQGEIIRIDNGSIAANRRFQWKGAYFSIGPAAGDETELLSVSKRNFNDFTSTRMITLRPQAPGDAAAADGLGGYIGWKMRDDAAGLTTDVIKLDGYWLDAAQRHTALKVQLKNSVSPASDSLELRQDLGFVINNINSNPALPVYSPGNRSFVGVLKGDNSSTGLGMCLDLYNQSNSDTENDNPTSLRFTTRNSSNAVYENAALTARKADSVVNSLKGKVELRVADGSGPDLTGSAFLQEWYGAYGATDELPDIRVQGVTQRIVATGRFAQSGITPPEEAVAGSTQGFNLASLAYVSPGQYRVQLNEYLAATARVIVDITNKSNPGFYYFEVTDVAGPATRIDLYFKDTSNVFVDDWEFSLTVKFALVTA